MSALSQIAIVTRCKVISDPMRENPNGEAIIVREFL
jgi:hypothetical protein